MGFGALYASFGPSLMYSGDDDDDDDDFFTSRSSSRPNSIKRSLCIRGGGFNIGNNLTEELKIIEASLDKSVFSVTLTNNSIVIDTKGFNQQFELFPTGYINISEDGLITSYKSKRNSKEIKIS